MIFTFTLEERKQLHVIDEEERAAIQKLSKAWGQYEVDSEEARAAKKEYAQGYVKRKAAFDSLMDNLESARFSKLETPADILKDAEQQAQDAIIYIYVVLAFERLEINEGDKFLIANLAGGGLHIYPLDWDYEDAFLAQKTTQFNPATSTLFLETEGTSTYILREVLARHVEALRDKPEGEQLQEIVEKIVDESPYTMSAAAAPAKAEVITADSVLFKANMPMYHGRATDALATFSSMDLTVNPIADRATLQTEAGDYSIVIQGFSRLKGKRSVNAHKLLSVAIAEFTQINHYGNGAINPVITIPLYQYARRLGYEIDEQKTNSPEAAAKEKRRAAEAIKSARKRIRQDLELLQAMRWTWQETINHKDADFDSILLFERVAIRKGYIIIEFGRNMAEYLKQLPITQYPQSLLGIDARNETAYNLGLKMATHYNIDNNQIRGTANRLKVSTLLAVTGLPTIETLQQETPDDSRHWDRRIKDPFETALDRLTGKVIRSWEYVKAKGEPLTEAEAYNITDYYTFTGLLVQFELLEAPEHEERLARRAEEKKAAEAKKAAKGKQRKKSQ